jgi:hypothetical protein
MRSSNAGITADALAKPGPIAAAAIAEEELTAMMPVTLQPGDRRAAQPREPAGSPGSSAERTGFGVGS